MCVAGFWKSSEGIFDEVGGGRGLLISFGSLLFFAVFFSANLWRSWVPGLRGYPGEFEKISG